MALISSVAGAQEMKLTCEYQHPFLNISIVSF